MVKLRGTILLPVAAISPGQLLACSGSCIKFENHSSFATQYQWLFQGGNLSSSNDRTPEVCYTVPGSYDVTMIAFNSNGSDTVICHQCVQVSPGITPFSITRNADTLFAPPGFVSYQWYLDSALIANATNQYYIFSPGGTYRVLVTDSFGCNRLESVRSITMSVEEIQHEKSLLV